MLAAMPPSAITVCALPNKDLQMIAVRRPLARAREIASKTLADVHDKLGFVHP